MSRCPRSNRWIVVVLWSMSAPALVFAESIPAYEAEVVGSDVFALSGPGIGYYPTMSLESGQSVTIVGERIGKWIRIRPPLGSFSWALALDVEEQPDGTGKIVAKQSRIRIGSQFTDARYVFQVTLHQGQSVQILDRVSLTEEETSREWYKILPPKDEVRYLKSAQIAVSSQRSAVSGQLESAALPSFILDPSSLSLIGTRVIPPAEPLRRALVHKIPLEAVESGPPVTISDDPSKSPGVRLGSLRIQLELMRTRSPDLWDVETPRSILDDLLVQSPKDPLHGQVLAAKELVHMLDELQRRYLRCRRQSELTLQRDQELAHAQHFERKQLGDLDSGFVAEGILKGAALRIGNRETYALANASGTTTHYVVPLPGLDIRPYLGTRVGLMGEIENRPSLPVPVLTADQLAPLEERMARPVVIRTTF